MGADGFKKFFQTLTELNLRVFEKYYLKSKNPLFVWRAILTILQNPFDLPFPSWVLNYLKTSSENLLHLEPRKRMGGAIASALGLYSQGQGTIFKQQREFLLRYQAVSMILEQQTNRPDQRLEAIFAEVADTLSKRNKRKIEAKTIENWFYQLTTTPL
jgi:hypothetical protein